MKTSNNQKIRPDCGPPKCRPDLRRILGALLAGALTQVHAGNILDNDIEHGFKPTITLANSASESLVIDRSSGTPAYGTKANPEKISATVVANLQGFAFTEIAEDMPVTLRVGGFGFAATLGDDSTRARNRDGTLRAFDPKKTSAVFPLRDEMPPLKPGGAPRFRTVGSVKLTWNLYRLTAKLVLSDVAAAEADGIFTPEPEAYPETNNSVTFACQKIPVEIGFGTAAGSRSAYANGRLTTQVRKLGSVQTGNLARIVLRSLTLVGAADTTAPKLIAQVPASDGSPLGVISFNGAVADMAAAPLTGEIDPVEIHVEVGGTPLDGGTEEGDDFGLYITDADARGQRLFTIANLPVARPGEDSVMITIFATDASGNRSRPIDAKVKLQGVTF